MTKSKVLQIRLSDDELATWKRAAAAAGLPLSGFVRAALDAAVSRQAQDAGAAAAARELARLRGGN